MSEWVSCVQFDVIYVCMYIWKEGISIVFGANGRAGAFLYVTYKAR